LDLPQPVKDDVAAVYALIAEAESGVHGVPVSEIHFHEVGTMDAIADVVAACLLMHELEPEQVIASPVNVGSGKVRCAHGVVPVPAPATVRLLQGVPVYSGSVSGELCTPTGAALLKRFVSSFGSMPVMRVDAAGYGMGAHDFEVANCVRALLGETEDRREQVVELRCNIDDMTAEEIGFLVDRLYETGALEAFTGPVNMKKSRPGTLVCVLCREQDTEALVETIFKHSTTIGVRKSVQDRFVLDRRQTEVETRFGTVRRKDSSGYGVARSKLEYDDLSRIAREQDIGLREVREAIEKEHGI
ncbi:MAG: nickel pincer cofactor biosynthesis protein LarC, partial [Coriobacteriales bacterium]